MSHNSAILIVSLMYLRSQFFSSQFPNLSFLLTISYTLDRQIERIYRIYLGKNYFVNKFDIET